jgi:hypothetical protein
MKKVRESKFIGKDNKIITRSYLFGQKEKFHRAQAKLPFAEKIKILFRLQKLAHDIKSNRLRQK